MKKCAYEKYLLCERFQVTFYFDRKSCILQNYQSFSLSYCWYICYTCILILLLLDFVQISNKCCILRCGAYQREAVIRVRCLNSENERGRRLLEETQYSVTPYHQLPHSNHRLQALYTQLTENEITYFNWLKLGQIFKESEYPPRELEWIFINNLGQKTRQIHEFK